MPVSSVMITIFDGQYTVLQIIAIISIIDIRPYVPLLPKFLTGIMQFFGGYCHICIKFVEQLRPGFCDTDST